MKKILKLASILILLFFLFYVGTLLADKAALRSDIIRLHVVANSDDVRDQNIKLAVRDAVLSYISGAIDRAENADDARSLLTKHLVDIQICANQTLITCGSDDRATVTLCKEKFGVREYDTFSLPSGVYESLRIEIGDAAGKNWWCVVFPSLCVPSTEGEFVEAAVSSGLDPMLADTLAESDTFHVRFFLLDCLGKLEKFFKLS